MTGPGAAAPGRHTAYASPVRIAASLVLGLFLGMVGALVQSYVVYVGDTALPIGMVLVLLALLPIARACAWWTGSRWGATAFTAGWLSATLVMSTTTSGGDLVLTSGTRQMAYLVLGTMLLSAASGYPLLPDDDRPEPVTAAGAAADA